MNSITKFFHELFNPHCLHCEQVRKQELEQELVNEEAERILREKELDQEREDNICGSCEILKIELAKANTRIDSLLDKLTNKPTVEIPVEENVERKPIQTRHIPWTVRKQQLEQASRERAAALRNAVQPDTKDSIKQLEEEMGIGDGSKETVNS